MARAERPGAPVATRDRVAVAAGVVAPLLVALILLPIRDAMDDANVVLVLVLVVVAVAADGFRLAGIMAAVSAAAWYDVFFTEPYLSLTIADRDELATAVLLLLVSLGVTELALWGRRQQAKALRDADYLAALHTAAASGATGGSARDMIHVVEHQLTEAVHLDDCRFEHGVAGLGGPARLRRDGTVVADAHVLDVDHSGFPADRDVELLVVSGDQLCGRFVMRGDGKTPISADQRRQAVALADQAAAALG
jgi:K+-sensing histidine kinase KdpD